MTRRLRLVLALLAAVASTSGAAPARAQAGAERIASYDVDIRVEANGSMLVTEVIDYDFGASQRHGILRDVPVRLRHDGRYDRVYPLDVLSVEASQGTPDEFEEETVGRYRRIKIGDPDETITGAHRYTIRYRVEGPLNGFEDHDELYWNAVGGEWDVGIERATARVSVPGAITGVACFSGPVGSSLACSESGQDGGLARFSQSQLTPHSALTVVVGFRKGAVPTPVPVLEERWTFARAFEVTPVMAGASLAMLSAVLGGLAVLLWRSGRDARFSGSPVDVAFGSDTAQEQRVGLLERTPTPVEFVPPDGLRPGQVGTLVDERANPLDVTATIVDLAVRGHLRIEEIPKQGWFGKPDWKMTKLEKAEELRRYERSLLDGLFEGGDEVKLSDLRNTFAARLETVQDHLYDDAVEQGWFRTRPDKIRARWIGLGIVALVLSAAVVALTAAFTHLGLLPVPLLVGAVVVLAAASRMPRRTAKGTGTLRRVQGFRRFIEESEAERARFAEHQGLFSEYLPYAIVFGATERWAKAFAGLDGQLPEQSWYVGSHAFTASGFSHSIDGFAVTTSGTITSTPSGSGSSGFSGGFSGGGGGGGGGGSW